MSCTAGTDQTGMSRSAGTGCDFVFQVSCWQEIEPVSVLYLQMEEVTVSELEHLSEGFRTFVKWQSQQMSL